MIRPMNQTGDKPGQAYQINNPEEFARNVLKLLEEGGRAMSGLLERPDAKSSAYSAASEASEATKTIGDVVSIWLADPAKLAEAQTALLSSYAELRNMTVRKFMGEEVPDIVEPDPSDNRFKDPEWTSNPFFDFW